MLSVVTMTNLDFLVNKVKEIYLQATERGDKKELPHSIQKE